MRHALLFAIIAGVTACKAPTKPTFAERRARHHTVLTKHGPSPQEYDPNSVPDDVAVIRYRSGDLELAAWYGHPPGDALAPALVYFHGGFAMDASDFDVVRPFLEAGFAVLVPAFRGENGNPGEFEMYYGEVDDARAAVAWLRSHAGVDADHVFAFGHSAGGVIAALISFYPDTGLLLTGSAGGLYDVDVLRDAKAPFDTSDSEETTLRVPAPNADQFRVPHLAYVGKEDRWATRGAAKARKLAERAGAPLTIEALPGDHFTSLPEAVSRFLAAARARVHAP
jgi:dipeptidyl aminopeptidase/acylaminoacyl peptidase